jgi:WD40 repeat protein
MSGTKRIDPPARRCPDCGQPVPPDAADGLCPACLLGGALGQGNPELPSSPARRWDDFELIEELGRGGMGVVWRARQISLNREVALKMILQGGFATETERRRFQAETQAAAALSHPNIVPIFEVGETDGQPFYAMKLFSGGSLAERLVEGRVEPRRAAALLVKMAAGVHHAHQRGILHRDLKPANVLLEDEEPLITDFGLAKRLGNGTEFTVTGSVMGSPSYMAPEQAAGQSGQVSTAADIYSLGAILFHLLTGQPPFQADTALATLKLVLECDPPSPRAPGSKVDRDLENICLKCLSKEAARRYPSADALREDLERWLHRQPVRARRAPVWERAWKWTRRHPAVAAGAAAVVVTAAVGIAAVRVQFLKTKAALEQAKSIALAERSARESVIEPSEVVRFDHDVRVASLSPDGTRVLLVAGTNAYIRDFARGSNVCVLSGHTSFVRLGKWSADGQSVVTASTCQQQPVWSSPLGAYGDQTVRIWDAGTGDQRGLVTNIFSEPISSVAINGDGTGVAVGSVDGQMGVWAVGKSAPLFTTQVSTSQVLQVQFSPDNARVLASSSGDIYWIHRKHPGGATYGGNSWYEENLIRSFDLTGRLACDFANGASDRVPVRSNLGLHLMPTLSSRTTFVFSPDGKWLATAAREPPNCAVWDLATGRRRFSLSGLTNAVRAVAFSRDGQWLAAACDDGTARVWESEGGRSVATLQPHPREVTQVAFAKDPRWLLTVCADNRLRVWDVENRICVALLRGHRDKIRSAEFSNDGEEVLSASADRTFRRWRWATFEQMAVALTPHSDEVTAVRFSSDGDRVIASSGDGTAFVCETRRGHWLLTLDPGGDYGMMASTVRANGGGKMRDAVFVSGDSQILTVRSDPVVRVNHNPLASFWPAKFSTKTEPFLPARLWDARTGRETLAIPGRTVAFVGVEIRGDAKRALLRGDQFPQSVVDRGWGRFSQGSYSHGGPRLAEALLWDVKGQRQIALLNAGPHTLQVATFNPKDGRILTASHSLVQIWSDDGTNPKPIADARGRDWTAYSEGGDWLLSEDAAGFPAVWDGTTLEKTRRFEQLGSNVWEAWFCGGAREVGILTEDGHLGTFDRVNGALLWEGVGSGRNTGLTVESADGRWLATVIDKHQVDLWDLQSHRLVQTVERHLYSVTAIGFSPDGRWLGTGDHSGAAWLWPLRLAGRQGHEITR